SLVAVAVASAAAAADVFALSAACCDCSPQAASVMASAIAASTANDLLFIVVSLNSSSDIERFAEGPGAAPFPQPIILADAALHCTKTPRRGPRAGRRGPAIATTVQYRRISPRRPSHAARHTPLATTIAIPTAERRSGCWSNIRYPNAVAQTICR